MYGISHRFLKPVSSGFDDLWGLDGSVSMRLKLGYAITNDLLVTLGRTNRFGLYDLELKYKTIQIRHDFAPTIISLQGNIGYLSKNTEDLESD